MGKSVEREREKERTREEGRRRKINTSVEGGVIIIMIWYD